MKKLFLGLFGSIYITAAMAAPLIGPNQPTQQTTPGTSEYLSTGATLYEYNIGLGYSAPISSSNPLSITCVSGCSGGSGGGGAVTAAAASYATGYSVDLGTTADAPWSGSGNASLISVGKGTYNGIESIDSNSSITSTALAGVFNSVGIPTSNSLTVQGCPTCLAQPVSGTFWPATQPVSGTVAVSALPTGTNSIGNIATVASVTTVGTITNPVTVVGNRPWSVTIGIIRPANTTAYAIGQVLNTATTGVTAFPTITPGVGNSTKAIVNNIQICSSNGAASVKAQFSMFLFNTASPTGGGFNDAATFAPTSAALSVIGNDLVGIIPASVANTGTAAYCTELTNDTRQIITSSSGTIFAALVLANAYTPASGETINVTLSGLY